MNRLLITGIHGFIGSNLVSSLKEQYTIYGLDIASPKLDGVVRTYGWNELESIPKVDIIIHLAGKAHDTRNLGNAQSYFTINTGLTQKIFDWYLTSGARKFIFFSSVKAVADAVTGSELLEEAIPNPQTPYGKSKLAAEEYLQRNPLPEGKSVYILRPCMIHGPGNKGNLNLLHKLQQKGLPWPLGAFENKRSFCSIDNVSYVVQQLIEKDIEPGIYQLADDEALSTNELIQLIAASQNKKAKIWHLPAQLIRSLARLGDLLHLPLNSERLKKLTESYVVSNQKLKNALGIEKLPVTSIEGLQKTLESFR
jgi:nucleoside-diphosphate-sugar epimerase